MSKHIVEELPARKHAPAAAAPAKEKGREKGGDEKSPEKRVRQAVYDIRYRARREDVDLRQAFAQYMQHSSLSQAERTAVRGKLFGKEGGMKEQYSVGADQWAVDSVAKAMFKVFVDGVEEVQEDYLQELKGLDDRKYKVRVTDRNGKSYVRYATRDKITQLRANPNIRSVEMTEYGEPYEGERKQGKTTARVTAGKKDQDGDGDNDFADVMSARMQASGMSKNVANKKVENKPYNKKEKKEKIKEGYYSWREDLREIADVIDKEQDVN